MSSKDERRDTLPGVGDGPPSEAPKEPRARQGEFTVPPQVFDKPNTGWFKKLQGQEPAVDDKDTVRDLSDPLAGIPVRSVEYAKDEAPTASASRRWPLVVVVLAAIALFAAWRMVAANRTTAKVEAAAVAPTPARPTPSVKPTATTAARPVETVAPAVTQSTAPPEPAKKAAAKVPKKSVVSPEIAKPAITAPPAPSGGLGPIY